MKLKHGIIGLLLVGIVTLLHFVPISHANGSIDRNTTGGGTTCDSVVANYSFRLIAGERKEYQAVRSTFVHPTPDEPCGYITVKAKLFVL